MRSSQFDALKSVPREEWPEVEVTSGGKAVRGKRGKIVGLEPLHYNRAVAVKLHGSTTSPKIFAIAKVDIVGADGKLMIEPVCDMTGRELREDAWVAYSSLKWRNLHSLEIGKITQVNGSGSLRVRPYLRDGTKATRSEWARTDDKLLSDAHRCIKLPVDVATMTMWILKDFEDIAPDPNWERLGKAA